MYVIRETDTNGYDQRVVMVTDDLTEAVNHFAADPAWQYVTELFGDRLFHHADGRTAGLSVQADDRSIAS